MQISRHWRLNAQRYRLEGFRNPNGQVSLQPRPAIQTNGNNPEGFGKVVKKDSPAQLKDLGDTLTEEEQKQLVPVDTQ